MPPSPRPDHAARTTPHLYIIDPKGVLVYAGGIDSIASSRTEDLKTATNYVNQALGEALTPLQLLGMALAFGATLTGQLPTRPGAVSGVPAPSRPVHAAVEPPEVRR